MAHSRYSADDIRAHGSKAADHLHHNLDAVLKDWESRVLVFVLAAKNKTFNERIDSLPYFLHGLIEALSPSGEEVDTGEAAHVFRRHGEQRANFADYTLNQVIAEYGILREVLFSALSDIELTSDEHAKINRAIDFGLRESCAEFSNIRMAVLRRALLHAEAEREHERHILNGFSDPFIAIDFDSRITFINEAGVLLLRRPMEELINSSLWDVLFSQDSPEFRKSMEAAFTKRQASIVTLTSGEDDPMFQARIYPCKDGASVLLLNDPQNHASALPVAEDRAPSNLS